MFFYATVLPFSCYRHRIVCPHAAGSTLPGSTVLRVASPAKFRSPNTFTWQHLCFSANSCGQVAVQAVQAAITVTRKTTTRGNRDNNCDYGDRIRHPSHSYRHNAAIPAARTTCGQHKGPNMMMFSPLYQQRSAAASKLRVRNIQPEPARTGLEQLAPVRNLQSGTIRLKPVQTNPAESKTSSQNQPEPVRTSLDRLDRFGTA